LIATGLSKSHGAVQAVNGVDLALHRGEILCLLGPSGCGKSSLLRLLAGLERPDAGKIVAGSRLLAGPGSFVPPEQRQVGLVFQDIALFPHLTAAENVGFGLSGLPRTERLARALALLERFQLGHRAGAYPHTLSGGEQQRVGIARALAPEPAALLLDEPFSGLDGALRAEVRERVVAGLRQTDTAILIVTHDPEEAMLLGDRLALMQGGRIVQVGTPEHCYTRPTSVAAACLLGRINSLPAMVREGRAECLLGSLPGAGLPDGPGKVLVRPEQLALATGGQGRVAAVRFGGSYRELEVETGGQRLLVRLPLGAIVPEGPVEVRLVGSAQVISA
jgi:iron(III) transport system ATP-binding protein